MRCASTPPEPVHLVDGGSSAGLHLLFNQFRFQLGDRVFGRADSDVRLRCEWRSRTPPPDLDARPHIASRQGVDLHPVNVADAEERLWLRALVWPEDQDDAAVLSAALDLAQQNPPLVHRLDVSQGLHALADALPDGEPRACSTPRFGCTCRPTSGRPSTPPSTRWANTAPCSTPGWNHLTPRTTGTALPQAASNSTAPAERRGPWHE